MYKPNFPEFKKEKKINCQTLCRKSIPQIYNEIDLI